MLALYLILAVAGLTVAVPTTLQVADGLRVPRFEAVNAVAFFALITGAFGLLAEQFDSPLALTLVAIVAIGIAGALMHFELFQALARRNGHPTAEPQSDDDIVTKSNLDTDVNTTI